MSHINHIPFQLSLYYHLLRAITLLQIPLHLATQLFISLLLSSQIRVLLPPLVKIPLLLGNLLLQMALIKSSAHVAVCTSIMA
ncbi:hypothetical protein CPB84DRAFT_1785516 [Gymnopilus junonius]|uniref:Uncharacterized protein n=1 Tax=Gymnopilus junonius TaxID=109634 RepID=A0A9P5TL12_GYMJU|nr:hypothetical protein CPB84DRAFT_1785516 [Gymnopilus junonius]